MSAGWGFFGACAYLLKELHFTSVCSLPSFDGDQFHLVVIL